MLFRSFKTKLNYLNMNLLKIILIICVAGSSAYDQLLGIPPLLGGNQEIILDGGFQDSDGVNWICHDDEADVKKSGSVTNVTLWLTGEYNCELLNASALPLMSTTVLVVNYEELPIFVLATSFTADLMKTYYSYLHFSHQYYASHRFLPNVAKFFRNSMDQVSSIVDKVVTYTLSKHVTTKSLDGSNPPDYSKALFNNGFSTHLQPGMEESSTLSSAFKEAFHLNKNMVRTLTLITHLGEKIGDHEIVEFVGIELIPQLTQNMKLLSSYEKTIHTMTRHDRALGEFIFDKEFS